MISALAGAFSCVARRIDFFWNPKSKLNTKSHMRQPVHFETTRCFLSMFNRLKMARAKGPLAKQVCSMVEALFFVVTEKRSVRNCRRSGWIVSTASALKIDVISSLSKVPRGILASKSLEAWLL